MSSLTQDIIKVAKVSESEAQKIETIIDEYFDLDQSEVTQREINSTIREAVRFMNMKCKHAVDQMHTMECLS